MQTASYLIIIILLLLVSALFSACEMAYSSVNRIRLKNYAQQGNKQAKALKIVDSLMMPLRLFLLVIILLISHPHLLVQFFLLI